MSSKYDDRLVRKIFSEIVASFSLAKFLDKVIYIKHFASIDLLEFDFKYEEYLAYAKNKGLPTEPEKLELLKKDFLWSDKKEEDIKLTREQLIFAQENKRNQYSPREILAFNQQIEEYDKHLRKLLLEKYNLIGETAEIYARRKVDIEQIVTSFYKDNKLSIPLVEDADSLSDEDLNGLFMIYQDHNELLNEDHLRYVALSPDFQMMYSLSDSLYSFYGVPVSKLTSHQVRLCRYGGYYKDILNGERRPPQDVTRDPDKLEDWFFARTNVEKLMSKNESEGKSMSIVGMTKKDLEYLGINTDGGAQNFTKAAKDKGGELSREEMSKLGWI